ncbi:hypothetical protein EVAR_52847_1 [Eumeta japonica]|uniref:Uncharacterized protein n=1 Tax=Eumeta variegata TaxID=151549 RepID=A0A4C1YAH8_EUMVA|nr:hypothetical protein EVAR_52847_1 [Eumeta japonica]
MITEGIAPPVPFARTFLVILIFLPLCSQCTYITLDEQRAIYHGITKSLLISDSSRNYKRAPVFLISFSARVRAEGRDPGHQSERAPQNYVNRIISAEWASPRRHGFVPAKVSCGRDPYEDKRNESTTTLISSRCVEVASRAGARAEEPPEPLPHFADKITNALGKGSEAIITKKCTTDEKSTVLHFLHIYRTE